MGSATKSAQLLEALDWATAENRRQGSKYYQKLNPSKFAVFERVAVAWLQWTLKADETAGKMFTGSSCRLCNDAKWKFEKKKLP